MKTRLAKTNEAKKIMLFIKTYWSKNHILANNLELFLKFYKKNSKNLNIIICNKNKSIISILGFVDYNQYSKIEHSSVWLALWFTSNKYPSSGILVLNYLTKKFKTRNIFGLGLTEKALSVLQKYGFKSGVMNHYFKLNINFKNKFKVLQNYNNISIKNYKKQNSKKNIRFVEAKLKDLKNVSFLKKNEKNLQYIKSKFLNNSYYNYEIYLITINFNEELIVILREIQVKDSNILRVVDIIGNLSLLKYTDEFFNSILSQKNAEYIDFLNYGIPESYLTKLGFLKLNHKSNIIIPNYFEPFIPKNKIINYAYLLNNQKNKKIYINKADGDQERPNKLLN